MWCKGGSDREVVVARFGKIGDWNVSNVTNMSSMFEAVSVFNEDIGNWDVSNVTDMDSMFNNAASFNQDLSGWCVSNILNRPSFCHGFEEELCMLP